MRTEDEARAQRPTSAQSPSRSSNSRRRAAASRDAEDAPQGLGRRMPVEHQLEHGFNRHAILVRVDVLDRVAGADDAFLDDGEIDAGPAGPEELLDHRGIAEPDAQLVAGQPGLGDDQPRGADAEFVADVNKVLDEPLGAEVLAEGAEGSGYARAAIASRRSARSGRRKRPCRARRGRCRSAWASPSRFSRRNGTGEVTGSLKMPVRTVWPCQATSRGMPTLTETTRMRSSSELTAGMSSDVVEHRIHAEVLELRDQRLRGGVDRHQADLEVRGEGHCEAGEGDPLHPIVAERRRDLFSPPDQPEVRRAGFG